MATSMYLTLVSATLLAVGSSRSTGPAEVSTTPIPELTTDSNNSTEENETYSGFGFTRYIYLDYPKIGYALFKRKMLEAFKLFDHFMNMKPALMKITNYILHSDTKNDTLCLVCSEMSNGEDSASDDSVETTIEAPGSKPKSYDSAKGFHEIEPQSDPVFDGEKDEVKKTKVEPEGFLSKSFNTIGGVFHKMASWLG